MKRILCPVDLSTRNLRALEIATALAADGGGELIFLHVAVPELPKTAGHAIVEVNLQIEKERHALSELRPTRANIPFRHVLVRGEAAATIAKFAAEENADLIVMSTHGRSGLSRLLLGSVAEEVLRHATCPVLTIRANSDLERAN